MSVCPYHTQLVAAGGYDGTVKIWNERDPSRPVQCKRPVGLGWVFDLQWDPCGYGVYGAGSDVPGVWWDPLWADAGQTQRVTLYSHPARHGGVWRLHAFLCEGQTAVCSAGSEGTVRLAVVSCAGVGRAPWCVTMHVARFERLYRHAPGDATEATLLLDRRVVPMQPAQELPAAPERMPVPSLAVHTIDSVAIPAAGGAGRQSARMLAYGGAAGVLRIHAVDPVQMYTQS